MINSEKAFDMLPYVVDIYEKIDLDGYRKKVVKESKGKEVDLMTIGIDLFKFIMKNSGKIKTEFFSIVAIADDKDVEEVKNQSLVKTMTRIKEIFADKELVDFFKSAMQ